MDLSVSKENYQEILDEIVNADSPVGIDAARTHVIILNKLLEIEQRLEILEMKFVEKEE